MGIKLPEPELLKKWAVTVELYVRRSVMSQSRRIKGDTTDKVFQEQCFLWERGAAYGGDFQDLLPAREHTVILNSEGQEKKQKSITGLIQGGKCEVWQVKS